MTIQYLITCVKKTQDEIKNMLKKFNISGDILVGNQLCEENMEYDIKTKLYKAKVFNMTGKGVSLNRNFLTSKSTADYITYLDDDMYYNPGVQEKIEKELKENLHVAVRFNVVSDNEKRPIKLLTKRKFVGFRSLSSFGVWGIFFNRQFLIDNNIKFNEKIGPGTDINHGEDGLFNKEMTKYTKILSLPTISFNIQQSESTWHGDNRDIELESFSHGYIYYLLYGKKARLMSLLFLITHMSYYPRGTKIGILYKNMKKGIKKSKEHNA